MAHAEPICVVLFTSTGRQRNVSSGSKNGSDDASKLFLLCPDERTLLPTDAMSSARRIGRDPISGHLQNGFASQTEKTPPAHIQVPHRPGTSPQVAARWCRACALRNARRPASHNGLRLRSNAVSFGTAIGFIPKSVINGPKLSRPSLRTQVVSRPITIREIHQGCLHDFKFLFSCMHYLSFPD